MKTKTSILSALLLLAAACSHDPAVQELPLTASPDEEVQKLDQAIGQAVSEQVDVLSPTYFADAKEALEDAKEGLKDRDEARDILREVAEGQAHLAKAREFAKVSTDSMSEVVEARKLALAAGAKDAFGKELREADQDLANVTEDIEKNKMGSAAENRTEILAKYLDLEVRAIRRTALNQVEGKINAAKRDGAEDWAPQTLMVAEKSLKDAENYIIANRHDTAKIQELSAKANADADKLVVITKEAKLGTKSTGETAALKLYAEREKLAQQQAELTATRTQLDQSAAQQAASAQALASQTAFNEKFEKARSMFGKDEAEVYRQGDNLVIRLKGLEFNQAKAELQTKNYALLGKVQSIISEMNAGNVIVEGHTDSTGSKAKNEQLSQKRAEAVKAYLETNAKSENAQYVAQGFGFQKPVASNKTASGRAQNRRVDIVIQPAGSTEQQAGR